MPPERSKLPAVDGAFQPTDARAEEVSVDQPTGAEGGTVPTDERSEPVTVESLLDYVLQVRDDLDDDHDTSRDDVLNMLQVAKAYQAAQELGLVRAAERPEGFLNRSGAKRKLDSLIPLLRAEITTKPASSPDKNGKSVNPQSGTQRGDGHLKLVAALTKHHRYAEESCLNAEPIGNNDLARLAEVRPSTASDFFKKNFESHKAYKALCRDMPKLIAALKLLNSEFVPSDLYGRRPADEDDRDD